MTPLKYSWQDRIQRKNALIALLSSIIVAIPIPYITYSATITSVESVCAKIFGALLMFTIIFLTRNLTKEQIITYVVNLKWIGMIVPAILILFVSMGQFMDKTSLNFIVQAMFSIGFFNLVYFGRYMKD